jgi:membrane complex biogenesis BtpA family protein
VFLIPLDKYPLIGVIHLPSLLNDAEKKLDSIIQFAFDESIKLQECGYSAVIVENFNDTPFVKTRISDNCFSKLGIILWELKKSIQIPIGLNILRNACLQAMTIASILDLDFIRCNVWESAYVTDQGIIESAAHEVIKYRTQYNSSVKILADIHVKHAYPLGSFNLYEAAENAILRAKADYIIVSGSSTGIPPKIDEIIELSNRGHKPMIGSGLSIRNLHELSPYIQGAIVGTSIKIDGDVANPIDPASAMELAKAWKRDFKDL